MRLMLDHLGLAVQDLTRGRDILSRMLPLDRWSEPISDPNLGVELQFGWDPSGVAYELLAPLGDDSPVAGVLKTSRNTLQHVAYKTPDFADACEAFRHQGALPLGPARPAVAFNNARVMFFLMPLRFVCELIEIPADDTAEQGSNP